MPRSKLMGFLVAALLVAQGAWRANGQAPTIGGTSRLAPGGRSSTLGASPGSGAGNSNGPGGQGTILGGRPGASTPRVPTSISTPNRTTETPGGAPSIAPPTDLQPATLPIFGTLAVPKIAEEDGPADGLTLDAAIERLVRENLDLRAKSVEIPQAQADILTASLRANPIFYADAQLIPYGKFTRDRPGGQTQYDVNVSYPFDLTHKRRARTVVASRAKRVLEAQFQDAVRLQIDNLYTAFADVLAARGAVRFSEAGVTGLRDVLRTTEALLSKGEKTRADVSRIKIQLDTAEVGLDSNREAYRRARRTLGLQLAIPPREAEVLEVRGGIRDDSPPPPPEEDLTRIALESRPDLAAYRLGIGRAEADVGLARANVLPDVYVLYQPYTFQNNEPLGLKSSHSWALGVTVPVPVYDRNQGNIQRARLNVTQTKIQLAALERGIVNEVRQAEQAYIVSLSNVRRVEQAVLPDADQVLVDSRRLFEQGELDVIGYLNARRDFNDVARQYLETLVAHRRSMLELNTAVGRRILP